MTPFMSLYLVPVGHSAFICQKPWFCPNVHCTVQTGQRNLFPINFPVTFFDPSNYLSNSKDLYTLTQVIANTTQRATPHRPSDYPITLNMFYYPLRLNSSGLYYPEIPLNAEIPQND